MAYIDVETELADYRVIIGPHNQTIPAKLLPEACKALMIEFAVDETANSVSTLANFHAHTQYVNLARECGVRGILVASAEPFYTHDGLLWLEYIHRKLSKEQKVTPIDFLRSIILNAIDLKHRSIKYKGIVYRMFERRRDYELEPLNKVEAVAFSGIRDTLIAERAFRLAYFSSLPEDTLYRLTNQSAEQRHVIAISLGTHHLGVVDRLKMNREARQQFLIDNLGTLVKLYSPDSLFKMFVSTQTRNSLGVSFAEVYEANLSSQ